MEPGIPHIATSIIPTAYAWLAALADLAHAAAMLSWALGLPLLFCHRWPRLAGVYLSYALAFTVFSFGSHYLIGECFLTTLARALRTAAGTRADTASFSVRIVNFVAGARPGERAVVVAWQAALAITTVGSLMHLYTTRVIAQATPSKPSKAAAQPERISPDPRTFSDDGHAGCAGASACPDARLG